MNNDAWWEGHEVQLPREERMFLLSQLTGKNPKPKKKKIHESDANSVRSGAKTSTVLVDEGDIDLDGEEVNPTGQGPDTDREYGVTRTLTEAQKKCLQDIHNGCGHPSKEEFLRALRLSRATEAVLDYIRKEFKCPACEAKGSFAFRV